MITPSVCNGNRTRLRLPLPTKGIVKIKVYNFKNSIMALQYRITKRSNNIKTQSELYIMQAIHTGIVDSDELAEVISSESSLSEADIKAVLFSLGKKMQFYLQQGRVVELESIGKFKMGFQCEAANDPSQLKSPKSIKKFHINYQPTKKMKRLLKKGVPVLKEV